MNFNKKLIYAVFALLLFYSCSKNNSVKIVGNIPNLPDGSIYLWKETMLTKIDSAVVTKGRFEINYKNKSNPSFNDLQILLKFNTTIPYTVLVDSKMKILGSSTGLSSEGALNELIKKQ